MFYLAIVNKLDVTVTLGWQDSRNPYTVITVRHRDMKYYKKVAKDRSKNVKLITKGKTVQWDKIKWMQYMRSEQVEVGIAFV